MPAFPPFDKNNIETLCTLPPLKKFKNPSKKKKVVFWWALVVFIGILGISFIYKIQTPGPSLVFLKGRCLDFVGRKEYLNILYRDLLLRKSIQDYHHSTAIKVLWGKGGFGKSELAIEFANRNLSHFSLIWTFYCDSTEHMEQGYRGLAQKLGILDPAQSLEKVKENVHFYLENHTHHLPWLLIYDNVEEDLKEIPQRGGVILVTSQKKVLNPDYLLEIASLKKEEALELLSKITGEKQSASMEGLIQEMENIPLLLNYAAHYIKSTPGCSIAEYHEIFRSHLPLWNETDVNQRYFKSLATSWQFPLKSLEKENKLALQWLYVCSYLSPDYIPEEWLDDWEISQEKKVSKREILTVLKNFGIIRYEATTSTFSIHRFFQQMIREMRKDFLEEDLSQTVTLLSKHARDYLFSDFSTWERGKLWFLHASEVEEWLNQYPLMDKLHSEKAFLYEGIGLWCSFNYRITESIDAFHKAIEIREKFLSPHDLDLGITYVKLGWAFYNEARFKDGVEVCEKSEKILKPFSETNRWYATHLNVKGTNLSEMGRVEEALDCHLQALKLRLKLIGFDGSLDKILPFLQTKRKEVLNFRKENQHKKAHVLQDMIADVGRSFGNSGRCYLHLNDLEKALKFLDTTLTIYANNCGKEHPLYARCLRMKALYFLKRHEYQKALKIYEQTLTLGLSKTGKNFAELSHAWHGMGWCYYYKKDYQKGLKAFKKAWSIFETHKEQSSFMLKCLRGLALCYIKNHNYKKGFKFLIRQIEKGIKIYENCPHLSNFLEEFYLDLQEFQNLRIKNPQFQEALIFGCKITEELLGKSHPLTERFKALGH